MAISIDCITKEFKGFRVLSGVTAEILENEFVCIVGPSGSGKTTLLRIIGGLEQPDSGRVLIDGTEIKPERGDIGFVFQENSLFPWLNVEKNVTFGLNVKGVSSAEQKKVAQHYIELVGLKGFENYYPQQLSGGMKQRAGIARAMAYSPRLLLMDEPFAALDAQTRNTMQKELLDIWSREKKTVIFVTHSIDEAVFLSDKVIVLSRSPGTVKEIITVKIERPRKRTHEEFINYREKILRLIENNHD
ncbi:MAG: ABC transporter ATP-binding protein [Bacillota bacterium]